MLYKNERWYYRINRKGPMEMQSHSWKREFVSLLTSNSTWICALIFPARLPSVSPGLEEKLAQEEGDVSTAAGLSLCCALLLPQLRPSSPRGCHHNPSAAQKLLSLPASHPGSAHQPRECSAGCPSLPEDGEQGASCRHCTPRAPCLAGTEEGIPALLIPSAARPQKEQGEG